MNKVYYVFVKPPKNVGVFNEVLARHYANTKVGLVKAESDVEAVMHFRDTHSRVLSPMEQSQLSAVQTHSKVDIGVVHSVVYQTYVYNGNVI